MLGQKVFQKTTEVKEGKIKNKKICRIVQIQTKKIIQNSNQFNIFYIFLFGPIKREAIFAKIYIWPPIL